MASSPGSNRAAVRMAAMPQRRVQLYGSAYAAFLALGAYQDLGRTPPAAHGILRSLDGLRAADGGYANHPGLPSGVTTATAAAVVVMRQLDQQPAHEVGMWLLDRCHPRGGFFAGSATPVPDLLSTATALHALSAMRVPDSRAWPSRASISWTRSGPIAAASSAHGLTTRQTASTRSMVSCRWAT